MYFDFENSYIVTTDQIADENPTRAITINPNEVELPSPFMLAVEPIDSTDAEFEELTWWNLYYYVSIEVKYNGGSKWIPVERRILYHARSGTAAMGDVTITNKVYKDTSADEFWYQYSEKPMIYSKNCTVRCTFSLKSTSCTHWGFKGRLWIVPVLE